MDFYAPNVKWIKKQKQIENKLFNELLENAIKDNMRDYKLNWIENLLTNNNIPKRISITYIEQKTQTNIYPDCKISNNEWKYCSDFDK